MKSVNIKSALLSLGFNYFASLHPHDKFSQVLVKRSITLGDEQFACPCCDITAGNFFTEPENPELF